MALKYPDLLEHNNSDNPLIDDNQIAGGAIVVTDQTARDNIPLAKRKVGMVVTYGSITKRYDGADTTNGNWTTDSNWTALESANFTATIYVPGSWDDQAIPVWIPIYNATVTAVSATVITSDAGTLTFNVEKRTNVNTSGTTMETGIVATAAGAENTNIDTPTIAAGEYFMVITGSGATTNTVDALVLRVKFNKV